MLVSAYRTLSIDQIINEGPTLLTGFQIHASADGGIVTVYDGLDATSGVIAAHGVGWANDTNPIMFPSPVFLNNGLFVDVGANVHHVSVYFIPLRGNSPLQPYQPIELKTPVSFE